MNTYVGLYYDFMMHMVDACIAYLSVSCCQEYFGFALPSTLWAKRIQKFELQFSTFS